MVVFSLTPGIVGMGIPLNYLSRVFGVLDGPRQMGVQVFSGPRRELCQQICGWGQYDDSDQEEAPFSALGRQGESSG